VHRDVKPENILVGVDGRARVADFGLARGPNTTAREAAIAARDASHTGSEVAAVGRTVTTGGTAAGAVAGTPRYMAPEQRAGGAVDAAADQFGLAVSLYEALAGIHPFPAEAFACDAAIRAGRIAPGRAVPRRIAAAIARALAADPAARWPTMAAFVSALTRAGRPRWPYAVAIAGIALIGIGGAWALSRNPGEQSPEAPAACSALPDNLDAVWNPGTRSSLIAGNPKATSTATWLADVIDHDARAWPATRRAVCIDDLRDRTWSPVMLDDAAKCLADRRAELTKVLAVTQKTAGGLAAAAKSLHDPASCGDATTITRLARRTIEPAARAKLDEVEKLTAEASAANTAGNATKAKTIAEAALVAANRSGDPLARAEALETIGEIELGRHDIGPAAEHLKAAYFEYRGLSDQAQTYRTALMVTQLVAAAGKLDEATEWLGHARAEAERTGATPEKRASVDLVAAQLLAAQGKLDDAVAAIDRGIPRLRDEPDPRFVDSYINALTNKAVFQGMANHTADSLASARAALAVQERVYGADHPDLLANLQSIGLAQRDLGQLDDAIATLDRARTIAAAHLPADSPTYVAAVIDYGGALARKDPVAGLAVLERARRDSAKILDAETLKDLDQTIGGLKKH
jgi:tetratricopeptide (TPR) repeat protein